MNMKNVMVALAAAMLTTLAAPLAAADDSECHAGDSIARPADILNPVSKEGDVNANNVRDVYSLTDWQLGDSIALTEGQQVASMSIYRHDATNGCVEGVPATTAYTFTSLDAGKTVFVVIEPLGDGGDYTLTRTVPEA